MVFSRRSTQKMRPLLEVANRRRACVIHHGPCRRRFSESRGDTDKRAPPQRNARHAGEPFFAMVTLCLTDASRPTLSDRLHANLAATSVRGRAHGPPVPARHAPESCRRPVFAARRFTSIAIRSARVPSRPQSAFMARSASCAEPTAPNSASPGLRRPSPTRTSAMTPARNPERQRAAMLAPFAKTRGPKLRWRSTADMRADRVDCPARRERNAELEYAPQRWTAGARSRGVSLGSSGVTALSNASTRCPLRSTGIVEVPGRTAV